MKTTLRSALLIAAILSASPLHAQPAPAAGPGTVTLPRAEYDRLLDLLRRAPVRGVLPAPGAVHRADLRVRATETDARATMTIEGEVFGTGTFRVPVARGDMLVDARMDGRPLAIVTDQDVHFAILTGPGAFSATLEFGVPLILQPGRAIAMFPVPVAPSAAVTVDVPGSPATFAISPGEVTRRTSAAGRTVAEAVIPAVQGANAMWSTAAATPAPAREARFISDVKTLLTIDEADTRLLALVDVTVLQGAPAPFHLRLPAGYTFVRATGATLDRTEAVPDGLTIVTRASSDRHHQFVITMQRSSPSGTFRLESGVPSVDGAQREVGEIAVDGRGAIDVSAARVENLRRIDVQEVAPRLAGSAGQLLLAFRYHRGAAGAPTLALDVKRFADASVLAAVAERAVATTLVTSQGRTLTEISMWIRNRAQPFMKVALPSGSSLLTVDVAGGPAKPVEAADGARVPLLRPGFRAQGVYQVSFVYLTTGSPFDKKGNMQLTLPRMDLPVNVVEWELFVPDRYKVDRFAGNALPGDMLLEERAPIVTAGVMGQIVGRVVDHAGGILPGATVTAVVAGQKLSTVTDAAGQFVLGGLPSGTAVVTAQLQGFRTAQYSFIFDQRPRQLDMTLEVGSLSETVSVTAEAPGVAGGTTILRPNDSPRSRDQVKPQEQPQQPSLNVQSLQRRAAGVLPVQIDVPRAGTSHRFVRPLTIDEEVVVSFRYRQR